MANEAELRYKLEEAIDFIVADGTGIEKGAVLKMADPLTASLADGASDVVAGIAAREKIASDGRTRLSVFRRGIFDMVASGGITCGQAVATAGAPANTILAAVAGSTGGKTLGIALETASDGERVLVELNPGVQTNAFS